MRVVVDLNATGIEEGLPDATVVQDDGDVVITFVETELRLSYVQFDQLMRGLTRWWQHGTSAPFTLSDEP